MIKFLFSLPTSAGEWVGFILIAVAIVAIIVLAICSTVKLAKNGKTAKIKEAIVDAVKAAEATHKSGAEKKDIAIAAVKTYCESVGIKVDDNLLKLISEWIDKYILDHNELEEIESQNKENK